MDIFTEYEKEFAELVKNYEKTKYFRERLCPDQYVGKIEQPEHWNNFKREPIFGDEWNVQNVPMEENIMIMILESPHKKEFDKNGTPLGPAMGQTGINIRKHIWEIFGPLCRNSHLILMNAIPFQCSLGEATKLHRNDVFANAWKNETIGKTFFMDRLDLLLQKLSRKDIVIVNACTEDEKTFRREKITKAITEIVGGIKIYGTTHPSSWRGPNNRYFKEI